MLNLNPKQRRFARFGLQLGEAVFLDRPSGVPVALRPPEKTNKDIKKSHATDEETRKEQARELRQLQERADRLAYPARDAETPPAGAAPENAADIAAGQRLLKLASGKEPVQAKFDALVDCLQSQKKPVKTVAKMFKYLAMDLAVPKKNLDFAARDLAAALAQKIGVSPEILLSIEEAIRNG